MKAKLFFVFSTLLFVFLVFYDIVVGFRMPSLWTLNYYLPSMFDGFFRRSLAGTLLFVLGELKFNYYVIASIQLSILAAILAWMYTVFIKNSLSMFIVVAFLVSANGHFLFHEIGYIDQLLYLILFISIWLFPSHDKLSLIFFSSSIFFHELTLFVTLPLYVFYIYIYTGQPTKAVLYAIPSLIFFTVIYLFFQSVPLDTLKTFMETIQTHANYRFRYDYYDIFVHSFTGERFKNHYHANCIFPLVLLFSVIGVSAISLYRAGVQRYAAVFVALVSITPLMIGFFGYDLNRWFFLSFASLSTAMVLVSFRYHITVETILRSSLGVTFVFAYMIYIGLMYIDYFEWMQPRPSNLNGFFDLLESFWKIPKL